MENNFFRQVGDLDMESGHLKPAGDLDGSLNSESKYFRSAGNLTEEKSDLIYPKKMEDTLTSFRNPGDLDMGVGYLKPAGDLNGSLNSESKYFRSAGNLTEEKSDLIYPKKMEDTLTSFRNPGDLDMESGHLKPAGDLNDINNEIIKKINNNDEKINKLNNNLDKIDEYLLTVVSGKKYDSVCELGVLMGAGRMIVGLEQLMQMVDEGYNIVKAEVINANMIEVEFQRYEYDEEKMERWRRF